MRTSFVSQVRHIRTVCTVCTSFAFAALSWQKSTSTRMARRRAGSSVGIYRRVEYVLHVPARPHLTQLRRRLRVLSHRANLNLHTHHPSSLPRPQQWQQESRTCRERKQATEPDDVTKRNELRPDPTPWVSPSCKCFWFCLSCPVLVVTVPSRR